MSMRPSIAKLREKHIHIPAPYIITLSLILILFLCIDVLKINNYTGTFVFLTFGNITNIIYQATMYAIVGFGMTLVIIVAGIDLSVGSLIALSGVLTSLLVVTYGFPFWIAILLVLAIGFAIGMAQGYIVEKFSLPAFVVTLSGMIFFRGLALLIVDGKPIFNDDSAFLYVGNGEVVGIPFPILVLLICFAFFHYLLKYTQFGRFVYAIGGNEEAARLSGINIFKVKMIIYGLCSTAAMVSGIILASRLGSGQPLAGNGWELYVITAVIIGGSSLSGGIGSISWTLVGALIFGLINNGMNLLNISPYYQWIVRGMVILLAVAMRERASARRKGHQHKELTA